MDTISRRTFLKLTTGAIAVGTAANFLTLDEIAEINNKLFDIITKKRLPHFNRKMH
jgi:hypothetical protein